MSNVRITDQVPVESDFRDPKNSPIVVDQTTDIAYYLVGSTVTPLQATAGKRYVTTTATLDFPNVGSNGMAALDVTLTGVRANDDVMLGPPPTMESGFTWSALVTADDTVEVRIHNNNGGSVNPASATWRVSAFI